MKCSKCKAVASTQDVVDLSPENWHNEAVRTGSKYSSSLSLSPKRLDVTAMQYPYDTKDGCVKLDDSFWTNQNVRDVFLQLKFDEDY